MGENPQKIKLESVEMRQVTGCKLVDTVGNTEIREGTIIH